MPNRAAIVTGASRGIGRAIAETLAAEGYDLTITARQPETLEQAADALRDNGSEIQSVAANLSGEEAIQEVVRRHRDRFGRLDVLVNNAGVGIGAAAGEHQTKHVDLQLDVNLRSIILFYRECLEMLRQSGAEHRSALVINLSSIAAKSPQPWLSVYSATKAAVVAYTRAMNRELNGDGVKSVAFCPGFVDTDMTDFIKDQIPAEEMLRPSDISEAVLFLLRVSPSCVVPEIVFGRAGETV
ncbi:MAG: SDR family oxidoreductase [Solirubrobacterales bacterium]|nr:SDR family oxidoreductase [Solirubrobacterales bacterium]